MNVAFERLVQHLDAHDVRYRAHDEAGCTPCRLPRRGRHVPGSGLRGRGRVPVRGLRCAPVRVPGGARPAVAETIVRANYGLRFGKLEMDYTDGELRHQVACPLIDGQLEEVLIARSLGAVLATLDRYLPAILSVVYGNELPKDAVPSVEQIGSADCE